MFSTSKHILSIDSRDRDTTSYPNANKYTIKLPREYRNIINIQLKSIELPSSYYVFSSSYQNTKLKINLYDITGNNIESSQTIVLPDGNYNNLRFEDTFATLLNNAFSGYTFTVLINTETLKLYINNNENRYIEIDTTVNYKNTPSDWGLGYYLGFNKNTLLKALIVISPNVVLLNPYNYCLLELNDEFNKIEMTNPYSKPAFAKIPIGVNNFDYIFRDENCCSFNETTFNPPLGKLEKIYVKWRFNDGNLLEFNNAEHSFTLQMECMSSPQWNPYRILNIPDQYNLIMLKDSYKREVAKNPQAKEQLKEAVKELVQKYNNMNTIAR